VTPLPHAFHYSTPAQRILFGAGTLEMLPAVLDDYGWRRVLLCTSPSQVRNKTFDKAREQLGTRLAAVFPSVMPHVQAAQVDEAALLARQYAVDAVIGLGGGSAVGMAKAVAIALARGLDGTLPPPLPGQQAPVPAVAIPTTYAGSEMTSVVGVTAATPGRAPRKVTLDDPRVAPRLVVYDPQLTLDLPPDMTAATGVNALAHAIEALYSITRNPLSSAAAEAAIRAIATVLPACRARGNDLAARTTLLAGAHLAGAALATVKMGVHHGACHALGGALGVPHAVAHSIMLPHAMRFNLATVAAELRPAAAALGVNDSRLDDPGAGAAAAEAVAALTRQLQLPQQLRHAGVAAGDLPLVAEQMLKSAAVRDNPRPVPDLATALELLEAAW
jgi:maleylacetate reductase